MGEDREENERMETSVHKAADVAAVRYFIVRE